jgi:cell division protein FtsB
VIFVVLVAALLVTVAAISGERGFLDVRRQKAQLSRLRAEVAALRDENASYLAEVRGLRSDPYLLEVIAREKLGYTRPGEIVFRFQPEDPSVKESAPPRAPASGGGS